MADIVPEDKAMMEVFDGEKEQEAGSVTRMSPNSLL